MQLEVLKRKKPPKWWLISSYKNVLQVLSGGLFADAKVGEDVFERFVCGDFSTSDFCQMVQA